MEGHGTIMRKHHILTAVAAAAVFSLGASTLTLAGEESTSGGLSLMQDLFYDLF